MYLIYLYRVIHFYITLRGLGWLGLGWDHASFEELLIDVSTDISIDCRSTYRSLCRSRVDRLSAECRSRVGRVSVESLSSLDRYVGDTRPLQSIGRYSVDSWSIVGWYFADGSCTFTGESFLRRINLDSHQHIYAIASVWDVDVLKKDSLRIWMGVITQKGN